MSFEWRRGVALGALAFGLASGVVPNLPGFGQVGFGVQPAAAQSQSFDLFFTSLDPYGTWIPDDEYGYIWTPRVSSDWRPYQRGRWVWTDDYGWMWQSSEPFAWATYHYGRWGWNQFTGWYWVPGDEWAPAWVSWRTGGGVIGWAPLPPMGGGYAYGVPRQFEAPPQSTWTFVQDRDFAAPDIYARALPPAAMAGAYRSAGRVYYPAPVNGVVVNRFMPRDEIARVTRQPPPVRRVVSVDRRPQGRFDDDRIEVYRPRMDGRAPARPTHVVDDRSPRGGPDAPYMVPPNGSRPGGGPQGRPDAGRPGQPGQPWGPDAGRPQGGRPDAGRPDQPRGPDAGRPQGGRPDAGRPDQPRGPDAGRPQGGRPDAGRPDQPRGPDAGRPQGGRPDAGRPDQPRGPDAGRPQGGRPDAGRPDQPRGPDAGRPQGGRPDAGRPDQPRGPDAGRPQGGRPDAGRPQHTSPDAGQPPRKGGVPGQQGHTVQQQPHAGGPGRPGDEYPGDPAAVRRRPPIN